MRMAGLRKSTSHGRIGEAVVTAKCWMNGIQAHNTNGLRANFAGCDLIVDTHNPGRKLLVQVKSGYARFEKEVYFTQASGSADLNEAKFKADFVVLVNIEQKIGEMHAHDGTLGFEHLIFYVIPVDKANRIYRDAVRREYDRPKRDGGKRSLSNLAVYVHPSELEGYREAWHLLRMEAQCERYPSIDE
jgi:hypothetical protein